MRPGEPPFTTLVVPVPEAERVVGRWRARHDRWAKLGVPAHVTIVGSLRPPLDPTDAMFDRLEGACASLSPAPFTLASQATSEAGVFVTLESMAALDRLARAVSAALGCDRGSDAFHLTVARDVRPVDQAQIVSALRQALPVTAVAREVWWLEYRPPFARRVARFAIGPSRGGELHDAGR